MHRVGYVHKDIHAGNVFVKATTDAMGIVKVPIYSIKVGDLGIANLQPDIKVMNTLLAQWMLPPEYLEPTLFGDPVGFHTDIYHAGLLLLAVLSGKVEPFTRDQILEGVPRQRAEALGEPFGPAIGVALRRHAKARYASPYLFWMALKGP
jgi:serine/threonine-protein kinase